MATDVGSAFSRFDVSSTVTIDHEPWARLLRKYVKRRPDGANRVDYETWRIEDLPALRNYLTDLQTFHVSQLTRGEQLAFWINLYNAKTIEIVLIHCPVASIRDINISPGLFARGPWDKPVFRIEGLDLSLNDIEHRILRPLWRDARLHYALNCASVGCPSIRAFSGSEIDAALDAAAREFVNDGRALKIERGIVITSSIYKWYRSDFGGTDLSVLAHIGRFAGRPLLDKLSSVTRIDRYDYDWRLNAASERSD